MYLAAGHFRVNSEGNCRAADYPPQVKQLLPREREIAMIVYDGGHATANEVLQELSGRLTNAAVRSMLNRLVDKDVLIREMPWGSRQFVYRPAVTAAQVRRLALEQFASDFHDGSLAALAEAIAAVHDERVTARRGLRDGRRVAFRHAA